MTYGGRRGGRWLAALMTGAVLLAGCGDDEDPPVAPATTTTEREPEAGVEVTLSATESGGLAFSEEALQAASGRVILVMDNPKTNKQQHAIAILGGNGQSVAGDTVGPGGGVSRVAADLVPGDYTYFCPVGQHRQQGMEGVLVIE